VDIESWLKKGIKVKTLEWTLWKLANMLWRLEALRSSVGSIFRNDGGGTSNLAMSESVRKNLEDILMKCVKIRDVRRIWRCAGTEQNVIKRVKIWVDVTDRCEYSKLHDILVCLCCPWNTVTVKKSRNVRQTGYFAQVEQNGVLVRNLGGKKSHGILRRGWEGGV